VQNKFCHFSFTVFRILLCSVVKNNVHTTAERGLQLSIVSSSLLRLELKTRSRAGKTAFSALGAKYTTVYIYCQVMFYSSNSLGIDWIYRILGVRHHIVFTTHINCEDQ
jgi:hypothetical protein